MDDDPLLALESGEGDVFSVLVLEGKVRGWLAYVDHVRLLGVCSGAAGRIAGSVGKIKGRVTLKAE